MVYRPNGRVLWEIWVAEFISGDKFVTGSRTKNTHCACADINVTKVAANGVMHRK